MYLIKNKRLQRRNFKTKEFSIFFSKKTCIEASEAIKKIRC